MQIIDCYAAKFNSDWNKGNEMKHALYDGICQWLRRIGQAWIKTGVPWWRLCRHFIQNLVGHDMVFIPMNNTENHWWLCVLYPARNEFQVLDSFNMPKDYAQETKELRCGIHSILQAFMSSSEKLESRWSNYDILNWDVVVKKNIPRQHDVCSCGIFTIKYMQYWNGSKITSPFSQKDMETIRKEMPAELIMSPFNKLTSSKDHVLAMQNF
nr:ubiquitin-like-specific protease 1A [Setaria viridis]